MRSCCVVFLLLFVCALPADADNDSSCDIGIAPAATLLLPYFEVDVAHPGAPARTTIFTITNVSAQPQIAHVTLWTDWGSAIVGFNVSLTPYGTQSINLADVFARGLLPQTTIPLSALDTLRQIFTTGVHSMCTSRIGGTHVNVIGFATADVVATPTRNFPGPAYFTSDVRFDNVLIGDYAIVDRGVEAAGSSMVHIRAVPEGGPAGTNVATNLPFTFYDHFDEHENSNTINHVCNILCLPYDLYVLPETSSVSTTAFVFPGLTSSGDQAGWMFLNLNWEKDPVRRASQNWVTVSMQGPSGSVLFDAAYLGNGCSPAVPQGAKIGPVHPP